MKKKIIYDTKVLEFVTSTAEFCRLLENAGKEGSRDEFVKKLSKLLPLIYVQAVLLPETEAQGIVNLPDYVQEDDYRYVQNNVWQLLKADDEYLEMSHDEQMHWSNEPEMKTVSEQLADIYQDLRNFVAVYAQGNEPSMEEALSTVKDNFLVFWGEKAVSVMRPVHDLAWVHPFEENDTDYNTDNND